MSRSSLVLNLPRPHLAELVSADSTCQSAPRLRTYFIMIAVVSFSGKGALP